MFEEETRTQRLLRRIKSVYRFTIRNDDTLEEKFRLRLTPLGLFIFAGSITIVMTFLVISLIAFTPLREYIPGYADVGTRRELLRITLRSDSLEQTIENQDLFIKNIGNVLEGKTGNDSAKYKHPDRIDTKSIKLNPSPEEATLRNNIESQDQYSLSYADETNKNGISNFFFFSPLKGIISNSFKLSEGHFGVDIVAKENEPIKSTLDGTVILANWSTETGYTITVQHVNNLISVYKHNSVLLKKPGDNVKAGDPIAIIGNTGELTTGPHLHFELWYNGTAVNPQDYMVF